MHLHALAVHFREARVEVGEARADRAGLDVPHLELRPLLELAPLDAEGRAVSGNEVEERLGIPVGVDVDGAVGVVV